MRPRVSLKTFRKISAAEEAMIRATMPRTSAADPLPLPAFAAPRAVSVVANRDGSRLVRPLTATLAERSAA